MCLWVLSVDGFLNRKDGFCTLDAEVQFCSVLSTQPDGAVRGPYISTLLFQRYTVDEEGVTSKSREGPFLFIEEHGDVCRSFLK